VVAGLREWVKERAVEWVRVKSKMLSAAAYNAHWHLLYLRFRSGDVLCYRDLPRSVMKNFLQLVPRACASVQPDEPAPTEGSLHLSS
jgi:hypothetical protein